MLNEATPQWIALYTIVHENDNKEGQKEKFVMVTRKIDWQQTAVPC